MARPMITPRDIPHLSTATITPDEQQSKQLILFWRQLGIAPSVKADARQHNPDDVTFSFLQNQSVRVTDLVDAWMRILERKREPTLADLVLIEYWFSAGAAQLVAALPRRLSYSKTLLTIRQRVAISLSDYSRSINWRRPVLFVSALKIARAYLRDAVGHEAALDESLRKSFTGRLGVTTVLISRFETVSREEASEALAALRRSFSQGNNNDTAFAYLLEAVCVSSDITLDRDELIQAIAEAAQRATWKPVEPAVTLAHVDLLLRCATVDGFGSIDEHLLHTARDLLSGCSPSQAEDRVRLIMAEAIVAFLLNDEDHSITLTHARLPFGLRTDRTPNELLIRSAPYALEPLRLMADSGEPLARGLLADYLLASAEHLAISEGDALEQVVSLRGGDRSLLDERSRLLQCRDALRLAAVSGDADGRVDALLNLADMLDSNPIPPAPLVMLARDVRDYGPRPLPIQTGTSAYVSRILRLVSRGDSARLYNEAGAAALASPDLSVLALGGRSGVTSVADYYGLSSETFVFKTMNRNALEREKARAEAIADYLDERELNGRFAVSRFVATYVEDTQASDLVTAARHYVRGQSLYALVKDSSSFDRVRLMKEAATFLGFINQCEHGVPANEGRRDIKTKELGRWLRACGAADPNDIFSRWWDTVKGVELVRRRDAHLHNWLLGDDNTLYAIDLEAQGWRPVGYELAQITDDHAFLSANNWETRRDIFDAYCSSRGTKETAVEAEWLAYQGAILSRIVWGLTGDADGPFASGEAESRLASYSNSVPDARLRSLSAEILSAWLAQRGLAELPVDYKLIRGAGRIRVSKSMAYHLRHNEALDKDEGGWATLEDLQEQLIPKLPVDALAIVATDKNEQRFEIQKGRIRAKYGHSVAVKLDYLPPKTSLRLYHASPWELAASITDEGAGINPMGRQFVHLTDSVDEAVANGMRAGQPLLYSVSSASVPSVLLAHGRTYLSGAIPMGDLSIVPVSCFWNQIPPLL